MPDTITSFRGVNDFLSNFYPSPIKMRLMGRDWEFASGEHAFQACKVFAASFDDDAKFWYLTAMQLSTSPNEAKKFGRIIPIDVPGWVSISYSMMWSISEFKYKQNPELAQRLLNTGDADLIEGNTWGDRIWGVSDGVGQNLLGQILVGIRTDLRNEQSNV